MPFRRSTWNEHYTNERQSRDSNRNATNARSTRTKLCVLKGRYDHQQTLVIPIAAITLASDSAISLARFCPSKVFVLLRLKTAARNDRNAAKPNARAPGQSADQCEHPFAWYFGAGWNWEEAALAQERCRCKIYMQLRRPSFTKKGIDVMWRASEWAIRGK